MNEEICAHTEKRMNPDDPDDLSMIIWGFNLVL